MVNLDLVRKSNNQLQELGSGLVAIFVGGTSGIGEATLKAFIKHTDSPKAYIVGRSETAASRIIKQCTTLNKDARISFIKADVSELAEVDRVCKDILANEEHLNLLIQTHGTFNIKGRDETPEGLDRKLCLNYYSKIRFIQNLLPLLRTSASTSPYLSRTLSVVSAGNEGKINITDLELKKKFSPSKCAKHSVVMTDLILEEFARKDPTISFVHSSPAIVYTPVTRPTFGRDLPWCARIGLKGIMLALSPFSVSLPETGERQLFIATNPMYPARKPTTKEGKGDAPATAIIGTSESGTGVKREVVPVSKGADGVVGSGAYVIDWNGETTGKAALLDGYRKQGVPKLVWEHTMAVFERVRGNGGLGVGQVVE